jgi:hypothetical protein
LRCWRAYQLSILQGYVLRNEQYAIALRFGIAFHSALEFYHKEKATGKTHDEALLTLLTTRHTCPDYCSLPYELPSDAALAEETDEADDGISKRNTRVRTRYFLIRAVVWYLEHYANDPASTIILASGKPAVELSFRVELPIPVTASTNFILSGHIDRAVSFQDDYWVTDYKTTKGLSRQFFADFQLSHQLTGYTIGGSVILDKPVKGAIIDGIALQVGGAQFARQQSRRSPSQVNEYIQTLRYLTETARTLADRGGDYPMNTSSCYFCQYKQVCGQPPEFRAQYLNMAYERKKAWNPLQSR